MADIENLGVTEDQDEGSSLAHWQQFVRRWQGPIAFGPFMVLIFVTMKYFADAKANWLFMSFLFVTVLWAPAVIGYALYLKYLE